MRQFIKEGLVFMLILAALCWGLQTAIDAGLRKSETLEYREWNDIYQSRINADLIIQGSSRAWVHFSPSAIDSALNVHSYNLGMNGYDFVMQYGRLEAYLAHNKKPKYIIQVMDVNSFRKPGDLIAGEQFVPYLHDPIIQKYTSYYRGSFDFRDYYIPLYRYNDRMKIVGAGLASLLLGKKLSNGKDRGFRAQNNTWDTSFEQFKEQNKNGIVVEEDNDSKLLFEQFLTECKARDIQVILVYPPEYFEGQQLISNRAAIIRTYREIAAKYGCPMLDYSDDPICQSKEYFYNSQHMNVKGVKVFTTSLTGDLKRLGTIK